MLPSIHCNYLKQISEKNGEKFIQPNSIFSATFHSYLAVKVIDIEIVTKVVDL